MGTPNWAQLKEQGRAKDIGIPWSNEEVHAVFVLKVPASYVRRGALTLEAYEAMKEEDEAFLKKNGEMPLEALTRNDLVKKAQALGVEVTSMASEQALIGVIQNATKKSEKPAAKKTTKKK